MRMSTELVWLINNVVIDNRMYTLFETLNMNNSFLNDEIFWKNVSNRVIKCVICNVWMCPPVRLDFPLWPLFCCQTCLHIFHRSHQITILGRYLAWKGFPPTRPLQPWNWNTNELFAKLFFELSAIYFDKSTLTFFKSSDKKVLKATVYSSTRLSSIEPSRVYSTL